MSQASPPEGAGAPLPREGRSWPELAQALRELKRDDLDWRRGRHAAFVWHADDAVEQVARDAYALFMTENGLGLRVFPSLRRMEADGMRSSCAMVSPAAVKALPSSGRGLAFRARTRVSAVLLPPKTT